MGIPYEEVVGTGTIATLKGKKDHPVIGLRCDIDALSIKEAKELPYRSENDGVMHACGHDGHISMLLTAAKVLSDHRDELNCTVKLIFQPAEEKTNGALKNVGDWKSGTSGYSGSKCLYLPFRNHGQYFCRDSRIKRNCENLQSGASQTLVNGAAFYVQYLLDAQEQF